MADDTEVQGVHEDEVGTEVQELVDVGATQVECAKQLDGTWTIRAS